GAQAQEPRLVLIDADAHLPGGFDPIEIDAPRARIAGDDLGDPKGDFAHRIRIRAADAVLHRPADRWPELQRNDARDGAREVLLEDALELRAQALARVNVLGDDDQLTEEGIGQLDAERQIEANRAAPDVGTPSFDVGIAGENGI